MQLHVEIKKEDLNILFDVISQKTKLAVRSFGDCLEKSKAGYMYFRVEGTWSEVKKFMETMEKHNVFIR